MSVFTKVLRAGEGKKVRRLAELVPLIGALEPDMQGLSDAALAHKTVEFKERLDQGETLDDLLVESYAVVREAAWRVLGQRHFDVQLMGGMALHFGWIAEMKTGEGKTLVSTLPAYLNALDGRGVHMVTVNEYLATRDSEWMGRVHRWLGLTVGRIGSDIDDPTIKRAAYAADITYGTNNEFGFDYLRDNMTRSRELMAQRDHVFAIVDEVDSILIDEARTPLIISGPADEAAQLYYQFASIARTLTRDVDYEVDEEKKTVVPLESGDREGRAGGRGREHLRRRVGQLRPPADQGPHGQGPLQAGQGLPRAAGRGEDRRRVHRPHARGPPVVRRSPPGRRGQGAGGHQRGEPHLGHGDAAELLPHVREVVRHDRHRRDRGRRVRLHLRPAGGADPDQHGDGPPRRARPRLQDRGGQVQCRRRGHRRAPRAGPAHADRDRLGGQVGAAGPPAREAGRAAQRAERQAALPGGRDRGPGRSAGRRHRRHQHGRPRRRHHPRRQRRAVGRARAGGRGRRHRERRRPGRARPPAGGRGGALPGRGRRGAQAGRPLRAGQRAPREPAHRQPAARPVGPSG